MLQAGSLPEAVFILQEAGPSSVYLPHRQRRVWVCFLVPLFSSTYGLLLFVFAFKFYVCVCGICVCTCVFADNTCVFVGLCLCGNQRSFLFYCLSVCLLISSYLLFVHMFVCTCVLREFLPSRGIWRSNSGCEAWQQVLFPIQPSHWPLSLFIYLFVYYIHWCFACMYVCVGMLVPRNCSYTVGSYHVDVGNWTRVV